MRSLHMKEYKDYLHQTQGSIHKILPLYEEMEKLLESLEITDKLPKQYIDTRANLVDYVSDLYDEIDNVLDTIQTMPHGAWYFSTKSGLNILVKETSRINNHKKVKRKVMFLTGIIQKQIVNIKE